jgi:hypothetical protein
MNGLTPKHSVERGVHIYRLGNIVGQGNSRHRAYRDFEAQRRKARMAERIDNRVFYFTPFGPKGGWRCSTGGYSGLGVTKEEAHAEAIIAHAASIHGPQAIVNLPPSMQHRVFTGESGVKLITSLFDVVGTDIEDAQANWQIAFENEILATDNPEHVRKDEQGSFILWTAEWNDKDGTPLKASAPTLSLVSRIVKSYVSGSGVIKYESEDEQSYPVTYPVKAQAATK